MTIQGIPTRYRGTQFRSRLEARWAAFFDLIGWRWVYEPFDAEGWIPDFLVGAHRPILVEVGPCLTVPEYDSKAAKSRAAFPPCDRQFGPEGDRVTYRLAERLCLVVGVSPALQLEGWRGSAIGFWSIDPWGRPIIPGTDLAPAFWGRCTICDELAVAFVEYQRPCGHDNDSISWASAREIERLWAKAGNEVQWMRPR